MKKTLKKIALPIFILMASIILGITFYAIQINKQSSIERQKLIELENEKIQQETELAKEKIQQEIENDLAEIERKQAEWKGLEAGVKRQWYNVIGVSYSDDPLYKDCVVHFFNKDDKLEIAPLKGMTTAD